MRLGKLRASLRERTLGDRSEIVDGVQLDTGDLGNRGIDASRHGEINDQQRPGVMSAELQVVHAQDRLPSAGGSDDDVGPRHGLGKSVESDRVTAVCVSEPLRAEPVAAGDHEPLCFSLDQLLRRELGHLAGADEQHGRLAEAPATPCASSTPAEGTLAGPRAIAVRERTRRPAAIADSNMRRSSEPAVPAVRACSSAVRT